MWGGTEPATGDQRERGGIQIVVLAASDFSRAHKSDVLEYGEVLTHGLPTERQTVLHREPRNEREERLSIFLAQFIQ